MVDSVMSVGVCAAGGCGDMCGTFDARVEWCGLGLLFVDARANISIM